MGNQTTSRAHGATAPKIKIKTQRPLRWLALIALLILVREVLLAVHGAPFAHYSDEMWQFMSKEDLKLPLKSLLYLHSQPPLWNFIFWWSNHLLGDHSLLMWVNKLSTYLAAGALFVVMRPWCSRAAALGIAGVFVFLPEIIAYENWDYSCHFTMMLVAVNLMLFSKATQAAAGSPERLRWVWAWVLSMVVLGFNRQTYSIVILLGLLGLFGVVTLKLRWGQLLLMAVVMSLPFAAWQVKNQVLFDSPSMSSWAPRNLFRIATIRMSPAELQAAQAAGCGDVTTILPFSRPEAYRQLPEVQAFVQAHAALRPLMPQGNGDMNSLEYAASSPLYMKAFTCVVKRKPMGYLFTVAQGWALYFTPASDYQFVQKGAAPWYPIDSLIRKVIYLQPKDDPRGVRDMSQRVGGRSVTLMLVFGYFSWLALRALFSRGALQAGQPQTLIFYAMLVVWFNALSNFFDVGENMRFRYDVDALYYLGIVLLGVRLWHLIRRRRPQAAAR